MQVVTQDFLAFLWYTWVEYQVVEGCIMLKNIPTIISPDLIKVLMEMGHGDEIVLADGNFPAASLAQRLVRCDGHGVPELLDAVLQLFPLDTYVEHPVELMAIVVGDTVKPAIWDQYRAIVNKYHALSEFGFVERFEFYRRANRAYAVVATGEGALYANVILKKGVVV
jgi:L-fucose mutarotase